MGAVITSSVSERRQTGEDDGQLVDIGLALCGLGTYCRFLEALLW